MLKWKKLLSRYNAIILAILFFAGIAIGLGYQQRDALKVQSILRETPDVDELDYHFMAVNLALKNQFPVIGFLADPKAYNISYKLNVPLGVDSMYLDMFHTAGSVHTFARPPLYSLLVGLVYKVFGVRLCVLIWFNIVLIVFSASLLPYMGYKIWARTGLIVGLITSVIFLKFQDFSYIKMDVEILSNLLFLSIFFIALLIQKSDTFNKRLFLGILIAMEFLCKPVIIFFVPLYLLFYYFSNKGFSLRRYLLNSSVVFLGLAIVILPWSAYINREKKISENERAVWASKIEASMTPPLMYNNIEEIAHSEANTIHALKNFIKYIYIRHTESEKNPIFVTNQFRQGLGLMFLNNEYCIHNLADMGAFGWLWQCIRTSYYNTHHLDASNLMKVFYFYVENPSYVYLILAQRLKCSAEYPLIFWLAPALYAIIVIAHKSLLQIDNKRIRQLFLGVMVAAMFFCIRTAFFAGGIETPLLRVGVFLVPAFIGLFFWKHKLDKEMSGVFYVCWLSIFLFILLVYGDQRYTKTVFAINCFAVVFYSYEIIRMAFAKKVSV